MAYGNYAPFYRAGYFNPMQTVPQQMYQPMMQDNNQFVPQYQQQGQVAQPIQQTQAPYQAPQQPTNDMTWVLNESEANSWPVAPNNSVTLWDKSQPTIYIKSVDANGIPSMRTLDFTERNAQAPQKPQEHVCTCGDKFVPIDDFKALQDDVEALKGKLEALHGRKVKKDEVSG